MISKQEALSKLQRFCAYQERCILDVRKKLNELGISNRYHNTIIKALEKESFLNEQRFAENYVNGKFRIKKWGRMKIEKELLMRNIPESFINNALNEIDDSEYRNTLKSLLKKRVAGLQIKDPYIRNHKVSKYLIAKGYEPDLVWDLLK